MRRLVWLGCSIAMLSGVLPAAEMQGVVADWNCVKQMVQNGREKTLRQNRGCSMMKNYKRGGYGLITDDKKYYRLDDPGNSKIIELLKDTPDKDNLHVVVTGDIQNETIKVINISML